MALSKKIRNITWKRKHPWRAHYDHALGRSRHGRYANRGIKCLLTPEEVKKLWHRDKAWLLKRPSIHRIDNDGNYCFKNCTFIELSENTGLGSLNRETTPKQREASRITMNKFKRENPIPWNKGNHKIRIKVCVYCSKKYDIKTENQKFCSRRCWVLSLTKTRGELIKGGK